MVEDFPDSKSCSLQALGSVAKLRGLEGGSVLGVVVAEEKTSELDRPRVSEEFFAPAVTVNAKYGDPQGFGSCSVDIRVFFAVCVCEKAALHNFLCDYLRAVNLIQPDAPIAHCCAGGASRTDCT